MLSIVFDLWIFYCVAVYCARDARSTSLCVIASVTERSFFDALHANTAAKLFIVGQNKCACKVKKIYSLAV